MKHLGVLAGHLSLLSASNLHKQTCALSEREEMTYLNNIF